MAHYCIQLYVSSRYECLQLNDHLIAVTYGSRAALIAADLIVLLCTWIKTFDHWRRSRRLKMPLSITTCLLRDGMSRTKSVVIQYD